MTTFLIEQITSTSVSDDGMAGSLEFKTSASEAVRLEFSFIQLDRLVRDLVTLQNTAASNQRETGILASMDDPAVHMHIDKFRASPNLIRKTVTLEVDGDRASNPSPHSPLGLLLSLDLAQQLIDGLERAVELLSGHGTKQ